MTPSRLFPLLVLLAAAGAAAQPPLRTPEVGSFLVADGALSDPNFRGAVVLLLVHDEDGTFGIVVNDPSRARLGDLVSDKELGTATGATVFLGGPVSRTGVITLERTDDPPEGASRVFGSVFLVTFDQALARYAEPGTPPRFYLGHAGWAAGQLEAEIAAGAWSIVPANDRHLFDMDPALVWHALEGRMVAAGAPVDPCEADRRGQAPEVRDGYRTVWNAATILGEWRPGSGW